jgi:hypothetical protein
MGGVFSSCVENDQQKQALVAPPTPRVSQAPINWSEPEPATDFDEAALWEEEEQQRNATMEAAKQDADGTLDKSMADTSELHETYEAFDADPEIRLLEAGRREVRTTNPS